MKNVAENQIKDHEEWTILRNGPFLVIFVTVMDDPSLQGRTLKGTEPQKTT